MAVGSASLGALHHHIPQIDHLLGALVVGHEVRHLAGGHGVLHPVDELAGSHHPGVGLGQSVGQELVDLVAVLPAVGGRGSSEKSALGGRQSRGWIRSNLWTREWALAVAAAVGECLLRSSVARKLTACSEIGW